MTHNPEEYCRLRRQFIEAAAKYEPGGYWTSIERTAHGEEYYFQRGRRDFVAYIRWPHKPSRTCMILAPNSGAQEEAFSTMKRLFTKAWLWLPRVIAEEVVNAAEQHLSPPAEWGLYWIHSDYQLWAWLLWFDWLWSCREVEPEEPEVPAAGKDLPPFSSSADVIARWGLDGSAGIVPEWLADSVIERKGAGTRCSVDPPRGVTTEPAESAVKHLDAGPGLAAGDSVKAELQPRGKSPQPQVGAMATPAVTAGGATDALQPATATSVDSAPAQESQSLAIKSSDAASDDAKHPPDPQTPKKLLANWREILIALGMKHNTEDKKKVKRLNDTFNGPIIQPGQGRQPVVDKDKLLEWWNGLEETAQSLANRARDREATVEGMHAYGREGEVVPGISGSVKRRRSDRQP